MNSRAAATSSWLLIAVGLTLGGVGIYEYSESRLAQSEAAQAWDSSSTEEPVPAAPPQRAKHRAASYFDPYHLGDTVAKLTFPRLGSTLFVVEGTDQKELKKGPGHMPGTALPGVEGNCVIAGHRDTHFRILQGIRKGDVIELQTKYGQFRYHVRSTTIVKPENVESLYPTEEGVLHLVTCYPFQFVGHAPERMVVEAALERPQTSTTQSGF